MTLDDFNEICGLVCQHCAANVPARYRKPTREWCHDLVSGTAERQVRQHTLCRANNFRNSRFAKELTRG